MAARRQPLLEHVHRLAARLDPEADTVLLERFLLQRDEVAFEALVRRHGPMVLGVCRRVLGNVHDAEDVFQATFLVLSRKAASIRPPSSLPAWLHGVAYRLALKQRQTQRRRQNRETRTVQAAGAVPSPDPLDQLTVREMFQALDEELQRLPASYRLPLILCWLEGRTQDEAADVLGWTLPSVKMRLHRGRALLHTRLARRGLVLGGMLAVAALEQRVAAALPPGLARTTVEAVLRFAAGEKVGITAGVLALAEEGMMVVRLTGMKIIAILLGLTLVVSAGGVLARQIGEQAENEPRHLAKEIEPGVETPGRPEREDKVAARVDRYGDPLPVEALVRLGTTRLRHTQHVSAALFAPDGKTIASGGVDDTVRLWDAATGKLVRGLKHPQGEGMTSRPLSFVQDGKTLVSAANNQLFLWDARTGKQLREWTLKLNMAEDMQIYPLAVSADGKTAASGEKGGVIRLWDMASGTPLHVLQRHEKSIWSLSFSPDSKTLASVAGYEDKFVRLWDVSTGKLLRTLEHPQGVRSVAFAPDGKTLASGGWDKTVEELRKPGGGPSAVRLWDVATGKLLRTLEGHQYLIASLSFSPDGKVLASGSTDKTLRLWDVTNGKELHKMKGPRTWSLSFSPDGKVLASAGTHSAVRLWDVATGKEIHRPGEAHTAQICSISFSPDGRMLATTTGWADAESVVRLWDARSGKPLRSLEHPGKACSTAFAPDGKTLASGGANVVCIWDATTGKQLRKLESQGGSPLAFSPDGKLLAAGAASGEGLSDGPLRIWDVATGTQLRTLATQPHFIRSLVFSPDGKTLASGDLLGVTLHCLGDAVAGTEAAERGRIEKQMGTVSALSFSPDSKTLTVAAGDGIHLMEVSTGKVLGTLTGTGPDDSRHVPTLAFSPNGRFLASAGHDQTVRLWEVNAGLVAECHQFRGHACWLASVAFSPDGRRLVSGGCDSTSLVWDVTGRARKQAHAPQLTPEKRTDCWKTLASRDAARAYEVMRTLASTDEAVPFFAEHLVLKRPDPQQVARLLSDLDSEDFRVRSQAAKELKELGEAVVPALQQAVKDTASLEVRRRIELLIDAMQPGGVSPNLLRWLRVVEVLEWNDTSAARELLKKLAATPPREEVGQEAAAALKRLRDFAQP